MKASTAFSGLVQAFFTDRLLRQRRASPHTIAGYRDTFRLLLRFASQRLGKVPSKLSLGVTMSSSAQERTSAARAKAGRNAALRSARKWSQSWRIGSESVPLRRRRRHSRAVAAGRRAGMPSIDWSPATSEEREVRSIDDLFQ